jgi:hypothetical protein
MRARCERDDLPKLLRCDGATGQRPYLHSSYHTANLLALACLLQTLCKTTSF